MWIIFLFIVTEIVRLNAWSIFFRENKKSFERTRNFCKIGYEHEGKEYKFVFKAPKIQRWKKVILFDFEGNSLNVTKEIEVIAGPFKNFLFPTIEVSSLFPTAKYLEFHFLTKKVRIDKNSCLSL